MDSTNSLVNKDFFDALIPYICDMEFKVIPQAENFMRRHQRPPKFEPSIIIQLPDNLVLDMELLHSFFSETQMLYHSDGFRGIRGVLKDVSIYSYLYEQYNRK
jgi:hypothetical protein